MNSRWQANKIGLINFWYYDEQEFPFVKGRMLLRGANGSGKSVTMQSVVPLLLDGNMSPERLDPFGSRDRKMSSYLLDEDDEREERTGYLYLEFKRRDSDVYLTIGMGIRARKNKPLDKWYFSLTDGRRVGKDFFLYKDMGDKVTLSKKELEHRVAEGGKVFDRQTDYMEYVNRQVFGFDTVEEYKELVDLLIQLRTPKLSKDFKPSVINDILSDSLQPLSDDDLRPMAEAIENMDAMNVNLKSRKEAKAAAEKIYAVFNTYNKLVLHEKAEKYEQTKQRLNQAIAKQEENQRAYEACQKKAQELEEKRTQIEIKRETLEKERESLNQSDAVSLKKREIQLEKEIADAERTLKKKKEVCAEKENRYRDVEQKIKKEEDRKYEQEQELESVLSDMEMEADQMAFQEFVFMRDELKQNIEQEYKFDLHRQQFQLIRNQILTGEKLLEELQRLDKEKENLIQTLENKKRELDGIQRKISELEGLLVQAENEWKEALYAWNNGNQELKLSTEVLREFSLFADTYGEQSDFNVLRDQTASEWIRMKGNLEQLMQQNRVQFNQTQENLKIVQEELTAWESQKEPEPARTDAVIRNRQRLLDAGIPYQELYKLIEFGTSLSEEACNHLEEALLKMGILDALVIDEQYKSRVLAPAEGCEDCYLFAGESVSGKSLLDVLELNDAVNDIFSNQRLTGILSSIAYDGEKGISIEKNGTYHMGVLSGTITGTYEAGYIGTKAREKQRQIRIASCREQITALQEQRGILEQEWKQLENRVEILNSEYEQFPDDKDIRAVWNLLVQEERNQQQLQEENEKTGRKLQEFLEAIKEKRTIVTEIAGKLYLNCNYEVFKNAKTAAEEYDKALISLGSSHAMLLRIVQTLQDYTRQLEDLNQDLDDARYDIREADKKWKLGLQEKKSIEEQLALTDYEEIKERLNVCSTWLSEYPALITNCASEKSKKESEAEQLRKEQEKNEDVIVSLKNENEFFEICYKQERRLGYVEVPQEIPDDAAHICSYLDPDVKEKDKDSIVNSLNKVYYENKGFLVEYQPTQSEVFSEIDAEWKHESYKAKRFDLNARYQGIKVTFVSLLAHLQEDIEELENLIKDGDRALFEDILANTVSRKIRGKINASSTWVKKMNVLMDAMDTSSGLKLNLRWRSKTAEKEEQLDTRELVELLKKDYRLMSEEEAAKMSAHFRSKVDEARRNARENAGMISFYQIMKDTLDYRKWFEFQLFSQKRGERQKELTNSVFGTFSGGEKAMSMYVPLFSAVVAKYQGGRADAPRLVSLDEAFAGVDNRNIRDMFRLMTQFEFDFIINSQVLWGDCDTLDALAIYQLVRPENAKFVTIMPYLWNGKSKELLDSEENIEQRAEELDVYAAEGKF